MAIATIAIRTILLSCSIQHAQSEYVNVVWDGCTNPCYSVTVPTNICVAMALPSSDGDYVFINSNLTFTLFNDNACVNESSLYDIDTFGECARNSVLNEYFATETIYPLYSFTPDERDCSSWSNDAVFVLIALSIVVLFAILAMCNKSLVCRKESREHPTYEMLTVDGTGL